MRDPTPYDLIDLVQDRFNRDTARVDIEIERHEEVMVSVTDIYVRYENISSYIRGWGYVVGIRLQLKKRQIETDRDEMIKVLKFMCV